MSKSGFKVLEDLEQAVEELHPDKLWPSVEVPWADMEDDVRGKQYDIIACLDKLESELVELDELMEKYDCAGSYESKELVEGDLMNAVRELLEWERPESDSKASK